MRGRLDTMDNSVYEWLSLVSILDSSAHHFFKNFYKKKCALDSSKYSTVPGSRYIKLKVDHEIVQFIDNTKHKICLSEVNMRTLHI